jgi:hypothetical protein
MQTLHDIYDTVFSNISNFEPELIYFAVGSALGHYPNVHIKPNEHQQYPSILSKYNEQKKVIILMDGGLETPLKMQEVVQLLLIEETGIFRMFINDTNDLIVFAIKHHYYFQDSLNENISFDEHFGFLMNLVTYVMSNDKKLIVQNYSGLFIEDSYAEFFEYFPREQLISRIIFDVSNSQAVCSIDFDKYPINYDEDDNFVQIRFEKLVEQKKYDYEYFKANIFKRINDINGVLTRKLRVIRGEIEMFQHENETIKSLYKTLSTVYSEIDFSAEINEENLIKTIKIILIDIFESLEVDNSILTTLVDKNLNQSDVIDVLSPLKALL